MIDDDKPCCCFQTSGGRWCSGVPEACQVLRVYALISTFDRQHLAEHVLSSSLYFGKSKSSSSHSSMAGSKFAPQDRNGIVICSPFDHCSIKGMRLHMPSSKPTAQSAAASDSKSSTLQEHMCIPTALSHPQASHDLRFWLL